MEMITINKNNKIDEKAFEIVTDYISVKCGSSTCKRMIQYPKGEYYPFQCNQCKIIVCIAHYIMYHHWGRMGNEHCNAGSIRDTYCCNCANIYKKNNGRKHQKKSTRIPMNNGYKNMFVYCYPYDYKYDKDVPKEELYSVFIAQIFIPKKHDFDENGIQSQYIDINKRQNYTYIMIVYKNPERNWLIKCSNECGFEPYIRLHEGKILDKLIYSVSDYVDYVTNKEAYMEIFNRMYDPDLNPYFWSNIAKEIKQQKDIEQRRQNNKSPTLYIMLNEVSVCYRQHFCLDLGELYDHRTMSTKYVEKYKYILHDIDQDDDLHPDYVTDYEDDPEQPYYHTDMYGERFIAGYEKKFTYEADQYFDKRLQKRKYKYGSLADFEEYSYQISQGFEYIIDEETGILTKRVAVIKDEKPKDTIPLMFKKRTLND